MNFTNELVNLQEMPQYETVEMKPVEKRYKKVVRWNVLIVSLFFVGAGIIIFLVNDFKPVRWYYTIAGLIFLFVFFILQMKALERRSYALRNHDILYKHGILSVITTAIPFNRIQHVAVREKFISRIYGLATLKIYTAGGSADDLEIAGLNKEDAQRIKNFILLRIK